MWFDPHWHARDLEKVHKEIVAHSLKVAYLAGATALAAMPNTKPPNEYPYGVFQEVFPCWEKQCMLSS